MNRTLRYIKFGEAVMALNWLMSDLLKFRRSGNLTLKELETKPS